MKNNIKSGFTTSETKANKSKQTTLLFLVILLLLTSTIGFFTTETNEYSSYVSLFSICIYISCIFLLKHSSIKIWGCTGVLLLYIFLSEFGLSVVVALFGIDRVSYDQRITIFLTSRSYTRALWLTNVAIVVYTLAAVMAASVKKSLRAAVPFDDRGQRYIYNLGVFFLGVSLVFMSYLLLSGVISFSMDYAQFRDVVFNTSFYQYLLIMYSFGICFVLASARRDEMLWGGVLFAFTAVILLMTGNRGEVLYPLLAGFGVMTMRGIKIKRGVIIGGVLTLIFFIPFVFSARHQGGWEQNINNYSFNFVDSLIDTFSEIGLQIRLTVYILDDFFSGTRDFLMGFSYYEFIPRWISDFAGTSLYTIPSDFNFKEEYATMGFNQVAESYANGGFFGVCLFHFVLGYSIQRMERISNTTIMIAMCGAMTSIFINMVRNKFAFVPTYLLLLLFIYIVVRFLSRPQHRSSV